MMSLFDGLLNRITMYRLVLYYLIFLLGVAVVFSLSGVLLYDPYALLFTIGFLIAACWITNAGLEAAGVWSATFGITPKIRRYISAAHLRLSNRSRIVCRPAFPNRCRSA